MVACLRHLGNIPTIKELLISLPIYGTISTITLLNTNTGMVLMLYVVFLRLDTTFRHSSVVTGLRNNELTISLLTLDKGHIYLAPAQSLRPGSAKLVKNNN